jgi:hypothetical protein
MTACKQRQLALEIVTKKENLRKWQEHWKEANIKAMGTVGGTSEEHEREIKYIEKYIKQLEENIKNLEKDLDYNGCYD